MASSNLISHAHFGATGSAQQTAYFAAAAAAVAVASNTNNYSPTNGCGDQRHSAQDLFHNNVVNFNNNNNNQIYDTNNNQNLINSFQQQTNLDKRTSFDFSFIDQQNKLDTSDNWHQVATDDRQTSFCFKQTPPPTTTTATSQDMSMLNQLVSCRLIFSFFLLHYF